MEAASDATAVFANVGAFLLLSFLFCFCLSVYLFVSLSLSLYLSLSLSLSLSLLLVLLVLLLVPCSSSCSSSSPQKCMQFSSSPSFYVGAGTCHECTDEGRSYLPRHQRSPLLTWDIALHAFSSARSTTVLISAVPSHLPSGFFDHTKKKKKVCQK